MQLILKSIERRFEFGISYKDGSRVAKVVIIFINAEFKEAIYSFKGPYSAEEWKMLGLINDKITELEEISIDFVHEGQDNCDK